MLDLPATPVAIRVDDLERAMMHAGPAVECPLSHHFALGFYIRQIAMPAGALITSKIHKTRHPFFVSKGVIDVWLQEPQTWTRIEAPYWGMTEPGTRRILIVRTDAVWTTFHATDKTDPESVEADIIEPHAEHLIGLSRPEAPCLS